MPRLAALLMVLAWMVLSAMPALAMHPPLTMPPGGLAQDWVQQGSEQKGRGQQGGGHEHERGMTSRHAAHHAASATDSVQMAEQPCNVMAQAGCTPPCCDHHQDGGHAGKCCWMAACAGCLTLLPQALPVAWLTLPRNVPDQSAVPMLADHPPRPAERPPRL
ncbi:hypothetical protein BJF92_03910 [Rhizobium rhizosphaerae]|uniref:CopL family metal-binding regulatory protein n=1 Tax=Xaviernesmea rhizosphaerae TaxID=1672749 RepID=A0A1Q9AH89_9HYPH|nr:hypothetical protein [Xaviernesmea rhizosphaerae]OLP54552.1 hypothetical protein BJF92_03910 [Xaviernesmea rhizosphaerae]